MTIKKPKVTLRKLRMSDLDSMCHLFLNDKVICNLAMQQKAKQITKEQEKKWLLKQIKSYKSKKPKESSFAIITNGEYVGNIGAHKIDYDNEKAEIGYWIGEPYWGQGITTEAAKQLIKYLFKRFKLKRIYALAHSHNIGSQRVMEKAGLVYEGTMRKSHKKQGKFYDDKLYAIVK